MTTSFITEHRAEIGVFGGSGFYSLLDNVQEVTIETPFGAPSDKYFLADIGGKRVAFLPRHGRNHNLAPQAINYRANLWGMRMLGVQRIISPCAVGSLQKEIEPGSFVILDQYVDRTSGRKDTFYDGPIATHVSAAKPYSDHMRQMAIEAALELAIPCHQSGSVVVIQGPRFSTEAESKWFSAMGWTTINMTQYPEVHLAKELELEVLGIALVTDYDCGLVGEVEAVSHEAVMKVFQENLDNLRRFLFRLIEKLPSGPSAWQGKVLKSARYI